MSKREEEEEEGKAKKKKSSESELEAAKLPGRKERGHPMEGREEEGGGKKDGKKGWMDERTFHLE